MGGSDNIHHVGSAPHHLQGEANLVAEFDLPSFCFGRLELTDQGHQRLERRDGVDILVYFGIASTAAVGKRGEEPKPAHKVDEFRLVNVVFSERLGQAQHQRGDPVNADTPLG